MINVFLAVAVCFFALKALAQDVVAVVDLSPAGSFEAKSNKLKGFVKKTSTGFEGQNIYIPVKSLASDLELRDQHLHQKLEAEKNPKIILVSGQCHNQKGSGSLKIKDITKEVNFDCQEKQAFLEVNFKIQLSDYKIENINYMSVGVKDSVAIKTKIPIK